MALVEEPGPFWVNGGAVLIPQDFGDPECTVSVSGIMDVGKGVGISMVGDLTSAPRGEDDCFLCWEQVSQGGDPPSYSPPAEEPTALAQGWL